VPDPELKMGAFLNSLVRPEDRGDDLVPKPSDFE
jgi:hypothetical protein